MWTLLTKARAVSHPIFGNLNYLASDHEKLKRKPQNVSSGRASFGTNVEMKTEQRKTCILCKLQHNMSECPDFRKKSYTERAEIVKSKGLCFNYLIPGHMVRTCKKQPAYTLC